MKLKSSFLTHRLDGEQILVSVDGTFSGLARSNPTAAFIVDCLKEDTTKDRIIEKMLAEYEVSRETLETDVGAVLDKLRSIGAIDE